MSKKPVIAVTAKFDNGHTFLHRDYSDSIILAGGIPIVIPYIASVEMLENICELADGLLLSGGEDIDPSLYGEDPKPYLGVISPERDDIEKRLTELFLDVNKPILAICRGLQLLNAVEGGTLLQDIEQEYPGENKSECMQHRQNAPRDHLSHKINIESGTLLEKIVGAEQIRINTFHHQAVKQVAPGYRVNAVSTDGIIEGIESMSHQFVLGVQWHPENLSRNDVAARSLFTAFIQACKEE